MLNINYIGIYSNQYIAKAQLQCGWIAVQDFWSDLEKARHSRRKNNTEVTVTSYTFDIPEGELMVNARHIGEGNFVCTFEVLDREGNKIPDRLSPMPKNRSKDLKALDVE